MQKLLCFDLMLKFLHSSEVIFTFSYTNTILNQNSNSLISKMAGIKS